MKFDFDTLADRKSIGNMKYIESSEHIKKKGVISYSGAEMDFKTAPAIIQGFIERSKNGLFGFTVADDKYLDSIIWWMSNIRNWSVKKEHIVPTYGTIHSVATTIRAFTNIGDGIIVQPPVYDRYEQAVKRLDRKIAYNPLTYKDGYYSIDFNNLKEVMKNPSNKLMVICNPHNPVGRVWNVEELAEVAQLASKYNVMVFCDEIFAEITFDGHSIIPYALVPGAKNNCIVSTALGKAFNLTGCNNANVIIPNDSIRQNFIRQRNADHFGSIDPMVYTAVCSAYTQEGADWISQMLEYIKNNISYIISFFRENLPEVKIINPEGTFTLWMDWNDTPLIKSELKKFLMEYAYLELDSGESYGIEGTGFTRMNIASPFEEIVRSMELLSKAYNKYNL